MQNHPDIVLDFLSNKLGSASIDYVINIYDPFQKGNGTPWGEKYTKKIKEWPTGWPTTTDLEIAQKLAYLFSKGKEKISDEEKIPIDSMKGWSQVERIINMVLNFPTVDERLRGPPSTLPEDTMNTFKVYEFDYHFDKKIGYFFHPTYLKWTKLEKIDVGKSPGNDIIKKIKLPYCSNDMSTQAGYIKYNSKGLPYDELSTIYTKRFWVKNN